MNNQPFDLKQSQSRQEKRDLMRAGLALVVLAALLSSCGKDENKGSAPAPSGSGQSRQTETATTEQKGRDSDQLATSTDNLFNPANRVTQKQESYALGAEHEGKISPYGDSNLVRRPELAQKGRPQFYIYNVETGDRVLDLSHLDVPKGTIRVTPDGKRAIVHYIPPAKFLSAEPDAIRQVYDLATRKLVFEDKVLRDRADEPQFDALGQHYFYRSADGSSDLLMKRIDGNAQDIVTVAQDGILAFTRLGNQRDIILLRRDGIQLYNPQSRQIATLEASDFWNDVKVAWFFGKNGALWRRDRGFLLPYKDIETPFWFAEGSLFLKQDNILHGWDRSTGRHIYRQDNVKDVKPTLNDPNVLEVTYGENETQRINLRKPNQDRIGDT
jgi:hypothetical protein